MTSHEAVSGSLIGRGRRAAHASRGFVRRCRVIAPILMASICGAARPAQAEDMAPEISAGIEQDTVWRGRVDLTNTVTIRGAVVRVAAGSTITFNPPGPQPVHILLEGTADHAAHLLLEGTETAPIVVRTTPDGPPGAILSAAPARAGPESPAASLTARHVRFERVGRGMPSALEQRLAEAAIGVQLSGAASGLSLVMCEFILCGPIVASPGSSDAALAVADCRFSEPAGTTSLELLDGGSTPCHISGCTLAGALICRGGRLVCENNVMIGPRVGVAIEAGAAPGSTLRGNYIHNRRTADDEQFCFSSQLDDVLVERNIFVGGTWAVRRGTRQMTDNVLQGVAGLRHEKLGIETTTHQLIADLPPAAVVERNVFIGPAYSLLATGPGCRDVILRGNVFDGRGETGRGVHLNLLAREPVAATIADNVFVGLKRAAVYDEANQPQAVAECTGNVLAEIGEAPYQFSGPAAAAAPTVYSSQTALGFPRSEPPDWSALEAALLSGELSVEDVRQRLASHYPPVSTGADSTKE